MYVFNSLCCFLPQKSNNTVHPYDFVLGKVQELGVFVQDMFGGWHIEPNSSVMISEVGSNRVIGSSSGILHALLL
jgi:hypothetical protein